MCENEMEYFVSALDFFNDMQWCYNTPVTEILLRKCLDEFPKGWLETLQKLENDELNGFIVQRNFKVNWPSSLITFLEKCKKLDRLSKPELESILPLPSIFLKGLNPKKQHEILHLTHLVHRHCLEENISTIVDFGAGLGYICQLLHHFYGYKILGLESNPQNIGTAQKRQKEIYSDSINCVKYSQCEVTQYSADAIQSKLEQEFGDSDQKICLIGLHACGELSIAISKIFTELKIAKLLILISCCYHKLSMVKTPQEIDPESTEFFESFPLSDTLKKAVQISNYSSGKFLKRTFLRLACQEPADKWQGMSKDAHNNHAFHVIARAILELYADKNQFRLKKLVQKATRKSQCENFETYLKDSLKRYRFENSEEKVLPEDFEQEIITLWNENNKKLDAAEIYTGLQLLLQSPAESLILTDRISWLKERGFHTEIIPVMQKALSPRSHAIVSKKDSLSKKEIS